MTTVNTLISDALIEIGKLSPADTADSNDLAHGLRVLNRMIGLWASSSLIIPYTTSENFALTSGTASYTMGSGGTASSARARTIKSAFIRDSNSFDSPITIIDQRRYNNISNKSLGGKPEFLFYDPVYAVGVIYFYKVPDSSYTAYIESIKNLHDALVLGDTVALPVEYEEAVLFNLRNRLAGSFGLTVGEYMHMQADDALRIIKNQNAANRLETMDMPAGVGGSGGGYDINSG